MQNTKKIVVARPVPSRPHSSYRSLSELLAGTMNTPESTAETTVAIKPKTLRFKPSSKHSPYGDVLSQSNLSESPSIYKPMAQAVTNATSLVANMKTLADKQSQFHDIDPANYLVQHSTLPIAANEIYEQSHIVRVNMEQDVKAQQPTSSGDRLSYDGYNWRKYGQKQVKGSEYPRSYYKCTHPSCPMKKKVERSFDGQIAEIVYKGEHNHPKPQPPKRLATVSEEHGSEGGGSLLGSAYNGSIENYSEARLFPSPHSYMSTAYNHSDGIVDLSGLTNGEYNMGNTTSSVDNDRHKPKRRKHKEPVSEEGMVSQHVRDPESLVQTSAEELHALGDGFCWRKYGQKVVKGNSYPRSYYRCTYLKCNVRKHIERASDDPRSFVTTYEGKHNH